MPVFTISYYHTLKPCYSGLLSKLWKLQSFCSFNETVLCRDYAASKTCLMHSRRVFNMVVHASGKKTCTKPCVVFDHWIICWSKWKFLTLVKMFFLLKKQPQPEHKYALAVLWFLILLFQLVKNQAFMSRRSRSRSRYIYVHGGCYWAQ